MRVLRVLPDLQVGGVQRMLIKSIPALRAQGVDLSVACIEDRGELADTIEAAGVPVEALDFRSRLDPIGLLRLRHLASRADIVHGQMYAAALPVAVTSALPRRWGAVASFHSQNPFPAPGQAVRMRRFGRWIDRFVAVSASVAQPMIAAGLPQDRIRIVHNGVELPAQPGARPGIASGPLRIVWTGRFVEQKRHDLWLAALIEAKRRALPIRVTLVGDGPKHESFARRAAAERLEDILHLPGLAEDVRPALRAADLFCSLSDREGFSNALLEACSEGLGFVASDIPPHREMAANSRAARLLPIPDREAPHGDFASRWCAILAELSANRDAVAAMGAAARARAESFTVERTAASLSEVYREALRPRA